MFYNSTIYQYLLRLFLTYIAGTSAVIIGILFISNFFDVIYKFKSEDMPMAIFWQMVSLKVPHLFNETSGIIGFISTVLFLRRLSATNELLAMISSGMPAWRVFLVPVAVTFLYGTTLLVIFNPLSTISLIAYERLEDFVTKRPQKNIVFSQTGVFFYESLIDSHKIIKANGLNLNNKELTGVTILIIDSENNFLQRIDAEKAILDNGYLELFNPVMERGQGLDSKIAVKLPTALSINELMDTFTAPEMILFWNLKPAINKFAKSGLQTTNYEIYYYQELFKPLFMAAMVFLACWFISLNTRTNIGPKIIAYNLVKGVVIFFTMQIVTRLMAYNGVNIILASLLPSLAIIFVSNFVILHFQEA